MWPCIRHSLVESESPSTCLSPSPHVHPVRTGEKCQSCRHHQIVPEAVAGTVAPLLEAKLADS